MNHWPTIPRTIGVLGALLFAGCQNSSQQLSLYAPFGPSVVPAPTLSRVNSAPYYTAPGTPAGHGSGTTPATAAAAADNKLSYLDPYRGVLVPGNFTPPATAARSNASLGDAADDLAAAPRVRSSGEAAIRVVDADSAPRGLSSAINSAVTQATSSRSSVKFQASPPSGVVRTGSGLLPPPPDTQVELAQLPRASASNASANSNRIIAMPTANHAATAPLTPPAPIGSPTATTPRPSNAPAIINAIPGFQPGNSSQPAQPNIIPAKPAGGNRLSLWDDPGDGSRVMPASHFEAVPATNRGGDSWRVRSPMPN